MDLWTLSGLALGAAIGVALMAGFKAAVPKVRRWLAARREYRRKVEWAMKRAVTAIECRNGDPVVLTFYHADGDRTRVAIPTQKESQ